MADFFCVGILPRLQIAPTAPPSPLNSGRDSPYSPALLSQSYTSRRWGDPRHVDRFRNVVDGVDDAIVTDANSPQILRPTQLFAAGRPGILRKLTNFWLDAFDRIRSEAD
jgi:hypothetical protein